MTAMQSIVNKLNSNPVVDEYTAKDAARETLEVLHRDYHDEIQKELQEVISTIKLWVADGQPEGLIRIAEIPVATAVMLHLKERGFVISDVSYGPTVYEGWKVSYKVSW